MNHPFSMPNTTLLQTLKVKSHTVPKDKKEKKEEEIRIEIL